MTTTSWQRVAPYLILFLAAGALAVAAWFRNGDSSPVLATPSPAQDIPGSSPPLSEPVAAARRGEPTTPVDRTDLHATEDEHEHASRSSQDIQAQLAKDLAELENKFLAEPISAAWSSNTEKVIADSLSEAGLAVNQAPTPVSHDAQCRSSTCRIRVTYRTEMDAQMGEIFLLGSIANELPSANFGRLVQPDGSVQIVMYADTGPARKPR